MSEEKLILVPHEWDKWNRRWSYIYVDKSSESRPANEEKEKKVN